MRFALLVNPGSGRSDQLKTVEENLETVELRLGQAGEVRRFGLEAFGDAITWAPERVVVAGGDGTIGPAASVAAQAGAELALVPAGTANNFARAIGIPDKVEAACLLATQGRNIRTIDLAWIDNRPFVNTASGGLAVPAAHRAQPLKKRFGSFAYMAGAISTGLTEDPIGLKLRVDGEEVFDGDAWQAIVAQSGAFGKDADVGLSELDDGLLDVVIFEGGPRYRLARDAKAVNDGRVEGLEGVKSFQGSVVEIEREGFPSWNVDGELCKSEATARFRIDPGAVRMVVP